MTEVSSSPGALTGKWRRGEPQGTHRLTHRRMTAPTRGELRKEHTEERRPDTTGAGLAPVSSFGASRKLAPPPNSLLEAREGWFGSEHASEPRDRAARPAEGRSAPVRWPVHLASPPRRRSWHGEKPCHSQVTPTRREPGPTSENQRIKDEMPPRAANARWAARTPFARSGGEMTSGRHRARHSDELSGPKKPEDRGDRKSVV